MDIVEILAGAEFVNAVHDLGLTSAQCVYHYQPPKDGYWQDYQVWSLSKEDFDILCAVKEEDWKEIWGWWRYADGSNLGIAERLYVINGKPIMAWDGASRKDWCIDCNEVNCSGSEDEKSECCNERIYSNVLSYLCDEIGASTERNVCACAVDLAKQNNMTLSELFKKYLGGN